MVPSSVSSHNEVNIRTPDLLNCDCTLLKMPKQFAATKMWRLFLGVSQFSDVTDPVKARDYKRNH